MTFALQQKVPKKNGRCLKLLDPNPPSWIAGLRVQFMYMDADHILSNTIFFKDPTYFRIGLLGVKYNYKFLKRSVDVLYIVSRQY